MLCILGSCSPKIRENLDSIELNTIPELVLKAYNSIDSDTFFEICQLLNDSIANRTDYFHLEATDCINIYEDEITKNEISLCFMESNERLPNGIPNELLFYICIKDEKTIFIQHKQANISDLKEKAKKYIFEPDSLGKNIVLRKKHTDSFGEVEVSKVGVILSINAQENRLSSNEWLLFFKSLRELINVFEDKRDSFSVKKTGKKFNSLTFEEKEAISDIVGYQITLFFD